MTEKSHTKQGLVHLYWGDGKGKTTAAMGLALRYLGAGKKVVVVQFLKGRPSGEIPVLCSLGAEIFRGKAGEKFTFQMSEEELVQTRRLQTEQLRAALERSCDLLVLDEACAAWNTGTVDQKLLQAAVLERPVGREVVLTGRNPPEWMLDAADYSTEMRCCRHPYERGVPAREGAEF